jgi:hypothetical protein
MKNIKKLSLFVTVTLICGLALAGCLKKAPAGKTVAIMVQGDRAGMIQEAFAGTFARFGFKNGGGGSRYTLNANLDISPFEVDGQQFQFARCSLTANLTDTQSGAVLLSYSATERGGHITRERAEERALAAVEKKINEEFGESLSKYRFVK